MTTETEIIACPACKHLVRVPLDWLGTQVQCPECKAMFRAPVREEGKLTQAELLSRPTSAASQSPRKADLMLMLPAFGMMLVGFTGMAINGFLLYRFQTEPDGATGWARTQVPELRKLGFGKPGTPEEEAAADEEAAQTMGRTFHWLIPASLAISTIVILGGVSIVLRWNYRLAKIACVLASLNIAHLCCVPGAVAGLWGLLMLSSEEGRQHFAR